ncbi:hypothetical protein KI688_005174 [Linnemannia hyalina]|uniref:ATP-dependent DNA helicase n=1 Tax=Linnemannia hyalina TaxID=64524 RepID=A0A9P7XL20_9FUNG|nr:hypothetical protein KI688_005174 [Linnemannia hyalina]
MDGPDKGDAKAVVRGYRVRSTTSTRQGIATTAAHVLQGGHFPREGSVVIPETVHTSIAHKQRFRSDVQAQFDTLGTPEMFGTWSVDLIVERPMFHFVLWTVRSLAELIEQNNRGGRHTIISCDAEPEDLELREIVQRVQVHRHTEKYCVRYRQNDDKFCRFNFPKPICDSTCIKECEILYRRGPGDVMINPYNLDLSRYCRSNTDMRLRLNIGPRAHLYISKYISKVDDKSEGSLNVTGTVDQVDQKSAWDKVRFIVNYRQEYTNRSARPPPYNINDSDQDDGQDDDDAQEDDLDIDQNQEAEGVNDQDLAYSTDRHKPFGGLPIVLLGDLKQLRPVVKGLSNDPRQWITFACEYSLFVELILDQNCRQRGDPEFYKFLDIIRSGPTSRQDIDLVRSSFSRRDLHKFLEVHMRSLTILTARTKTANDHNDEAMDNPLDANTRVVFIAEDSRGNTSDAASWILAIEGDTGLQTELTLWIGALVIVTSNLAPNAGVMNGSIEVVMEIESSHVQGENGGRPVPEEMSH